VLFHSLDYLVFLPLTLGAYWLVPERMRLHVLALGSLVFYASWSVGYLPLLLGVVLVAWGGGLWIARNASESSGWVVALLFLPLLIFKYWNWVAENTESLMGFGESVSWIPRSSLGLPVGISFFTFQAVAYLLDVRKGAAPERSPLRFGTFIAFFPQLVAGPIVRMNQLLPQLSKSQLLARGDVGEGLYRIGAGMFKKVVIADTLRVGVVTPVFLEPSAFTSPEVLVALYAYTLQVYCDFSGYTDIAIGSARLFGIHLPENFKRPYAATSVTDFWRRWHITLSNWVRDYVYFGLGGARVSSEWKVYRNLLLTLLVIGVWHGASWNFVVYGLLHGVAVCLNRWMRKSHGRKAGELPPGAWAWFWRFLVTFHFVVFARILFRAPDFGMSLEVVEALLRADWAWPRFSSLCWILLFLGYALHGVGDSVERKVRSLFVRGGPGFWAVGLGLLAALCMKIGDGESLAFVYYRF